MRKVVRAEVLKLDRSRGKSVGRAPGDYLLHFIQIYATRRP